MIGLTLCILGFCLTYWRARRSFGDGLVVLLTFGYAYGLLRARFPDVATHFVYDASLLAFYIAQFAVPSSETGSVSSQTARGWTVALVAWPFVCMAYSPAIAETQPFLVQCVGLRDAALALPLIVLATRMKRADMDKLAPALAALNLVALAFTLAEYVLGIEAIIPKTAVTDIIYQSKDVASSSGGLFYRLPSTFLDAHQYGGTMVLTLPFITHGLESGRRVRILCWFGLAAAVVGAFLCGARVPVIMLVLSTLYTMVSLRMRASTFFAFAIAAAGVSYLVVNAERLQRFTTLGDSDLVQNRFALSVNLSFFEILANYPLGAGLASAFGTSIPYFLSEAVGKRGQFGIENEYGHILLEQGVVGLTLWLAFIVYTTFRRQKTKETSSTTIAYMQALAAITWLVCLIGTGTIYGIPSATLLFTMVGFRLTDPVSDRTARQLRHVGRAKRAFTPPRRALGGSRVPSPSLVNRGARS